MVDRRRVVPELGDESLTKQSMAQESDINQIVARHIAHGVPLFVDGRATYGDFSSFLDYHGSLNAVLRAQEEFNALPAAVREHVGNDPGKFLDLVYDPARRDELVALGLVDAAFPAGAVPAPPAPEGEITTEVPAAPPVVP